MRILYIINKMTNLAGIERILSCKMNYFADNTDYQILLTTYEQQNCELSFKLNDKITYKPIDISIPRRNHYSFIQWLILYILARKQFKTKFHNLLCHTHPDIVICTVYSYEVMDIIINSSNRMKAKVIMESHIMGETVSMAKYQYNRILFKLFTFWDQHIMRSLKKCNIVVALTKEDASYWKQYTTKIAVIPNMLTITPKKVRDYNIKRVIAIGRFSHQKGFDLLLEAWYIINKSISDWHLYIYGNENREPYQRIVDKYQMNHNTHLMGATKDIVEEISKSSLFVMSSRFEGFPLVLGEAMSCGLPCVSFDCPYGPRDIITDGEDGILVENGNIDALARALEKLMEDVTLRKSMGEKAINNVSRYDRDTIMKQWEQLFLSI